MLYAWYTNDGQRHLGLDGKCAFELRWNPKLAYDSAVLVHLIDTAVCAISSHREWSRGAEKLVWTRYDTPFYYYCCYYAAKCAHWLMMILALVLLLATQHACTLSLSATGVKIVCPIHSVTEAKWCPLFSYRTMLAALNLHATRAFVERTVNANDNHSCPNGTLVSNMNKAIAAPADVDDTVWACEPFEKWFVRVPNVPFKTRNS